MKKVVWQRHHLSYDPEIVVRIRRSVHWIATQIQRFKGLHKDEKKALIDAVKRQVLLK